MALPRFLEKILPVKIIEDNSNYYDIKSLGNIVIPEKITDENAFSLANSVTELFFPIDFYADRISKLRFFIANKSGKEVTNNPYNRLINEINPFYSFNDLIYQYIFSYLAFGNGITLAQAPSIYTGVTANNISRIDVLNPDLVNISEYTNVSMLNYSKLNDLIKQFKYNDAPNHSLPIDNIIIDNYGLTRQTNSNVLSRSPMMAANKSIDTLLSVYSARYNVYSNNGAAGYLARKTNNNGMNMSLEMALSEGTTRQKILDDINDRNGLTGKHNLWGISSTPIEFVKTIATISELLPLDETLENSIKISSVLQIPPVLVPRKDQSTYDNQSNAEKIVWENGLLSMVDLTNKNWTKILRLENTPYQLGADISNVSALVENESDNEDLRTKKLDNLKKIKELNPEIDITNELNKILNGKE